MNLEMEIEEIPENNMILQQQQHVLPLIPKQLTKVKRAANPAPKAQTTYEDILDKIGVHMSGNGKLVAKSNAPVHNTATTSTPTVVNTPLNQSYIYNKYFQNELLPQQPEIRRPRTLQEYRNMLLEDYIKREQIKQLKSTKLFLPSASNITTVARLPKDMNQLFRMR